MSFVIPLLAVLIYAAGLLSPLTPSYGTPAISSLLGFWLLPIALLAMTVARARSRAARIAGALLIGFVFFSYLWIALPFWPGR